MGKLKNKHDHALTQWLKVIIFAILMLAPFFSVMSRCLYVTCNKNAKDSYSEYYLKSYEQLSSYSEMHSGISYDFKYRSGEGSTGSAVYWFSSISIDFEDYGFNPNTYIGISFYAHGITRAWYSETQFQQLSTVWGSTLKEFTLTLTSVTNIPTNIYYGGVNIYFGSYRLGTLDNAFEYSINQLNETPIFNWVQNTAIYTPVNAMTTGLGFNSNNNVIALLLTYWTLLTAIYVIFDIILACFIKLTHLIQGND